MSYFFRRQQMVNGDLPGHPFRGNQYVDANGAGGGGDPSEGLVSAYADAWMEGESGYDKRSLNFLASASTSLEDWASTMKKATPGGYNKFSAGRVSNALKPWADKIKVRGGRELSPVMYIEGDDATLRSILTDSSIRRKLKADEFDIYSEGYDVKDWGKYDPDKGDPPVVHSFKGPVPRLWWD